MDKLSDDNKLVIHNNLLDIKYHKQKLNNIDTKELEFIDKMTYHQKLAIFKKIYNESNLTDLLLKYELENHNLGKEDGYENIIKSVNYYLKRYTRKAGGYHMDDWKLHRHNSTIFELDTNEFVFVNTIGTDYLNETSEFVAKLYNFFHRTYKKCTLKIFKEKPYYVFVLKFVV
jgi:hypothetical protein